ncbi:MAG: hypothetical protein RXO54_05690 [Acidilobus sp.]
MSDRKKVTKKKLLKAIIKLIAPLNLIVGIFVGAIYLFSNNTFRSILSLWLCVLDVDLIALYFLYLSKDDLRSPITKKRLGAIKRVKLMATIAHIFTAIGIFGDGLVLASYIIDSRAATFASQGVALTLLMLILFILPAYVVKKETEKAIRLGKESVTGA